MGKNVLVNQNSLLVSKIQMVKFFLSPMFVFIIFLSWTVFWEISRQKFAQQLKSINPSLWDRLGSPRGLISRLIVRDGFDLELYLLTKKYKDELDQPLKEEAEKLRITINGVIYGPPRIARKILVVT